MSIQGDSLSEEALLKELMASSGLMKNSKAMKKPFTSSNLNQRISQPSVKQKTGMANLKWKK